MDNTAYIQSLNMGDGNANCGNITGSFNETFNVSDEIAQIMHWLSPLEPQKRHQDVRTDRFDGIGDWLLESTEFREWRGSESRTNDVVLFCSGNPGVGKTNLCSLVIDSLCDEAKKEGIAVAVAGLYCDFLAQGEQTITNMMGAILKQLLGGDDIPEHVWEAFQKAKKEFGGRGLRLQDLIEMLKTTIAALPKVFICIDALDECLPKYLPELLESLGDIVRESPHTRIFLTGRPHVGADVQRVFTMAAIIPISPNIDDIRGYLERRLDRDSELEAMSDALRADILRIIPDRISEIFLLVSLQIDAILGEVTVRQRRKKLDEIEQGTGLSDAYTATLDRLKAQKRVKSELGLKVLMWVSHSERPLRAKELCHALGVEIGSSNLDVENVPALRTLLAYSLGLVTVEAASSTVRLVHYTLQEYLCNNPTLFNNPHSTIAEVCLTYLDYPSVRELSPTLYSAPPAMPLLEYASCYWGKHTRREMTENVKTLTLRLLEGFDRHIGAQLLLMSYDRDRHLLEPWYHWEGGPEGFTGLHGAAFFGIAGILAALLEMKRWDVNITDSVGFTALMWASRYGNNGIVKVLLEREDIDPNTADTYGGQTPLSWAVENGHESIVKMLLDRKDVNINTMDNEGQTSLWRASRKGHEGVVKMLLEREDIDPNAAEGQYGQTPLSWAVENRHEAVVKMLLDRKDVNPDPVDKRGQTPLLWASRNGHERVVKMLLQREDIDPNTVNTYFGQTPLSWATWTGNESTVKMLLDRKDVNPDPVDKGGQTPLLWASRKGREGVVKMLLDRKDVNPNTLDSEGQTPLLLASRYGYEGAVRMLLEWGDIDPNTADTYFGRTPLSRAAEKGHEGIVKMLLEREDVNPNTVDKWRQTPLLWASSKGHVGIVKMLLKRQDVHPDMADTPCGRTPLLWATINGHTEIVKLLLNRKDVNFKVMDNGNQTPLSFALSRGHGQVVKLLLEREKHNSETLNNDLPSPEPSKLPEAPSRQPPIPRYSKCKPIPHTYDTRPILPIPVVWYSIIAFFICVLAISVFYSSPPSLSLILFPFNK